MERYIGMDVHAASCTLAPYPYDAYLPEHGRDMTVGPRAGDVEHVGGGQEGLTAQRAAN